VQGRGRAPTPAPPGRRQPPPRASQGATPCKSSTELLAGAATAAMGVAQRPSRHGPLERHADLALGPPDPDAGQGGRPTLSSRRRRRIATLSRPRTPRASPFPTAVATTAKEIPAVTLQQGARPCRWPALAAALRGRRREGREG
jgi:hypothetical protein